jgi:hypothetical protein
MPTDEKSSDAAVPAVKGSNDAINLAFGFLGGTDPQFKQHAGVYGESDQLGVIGHAGDGGTGVFGNNKGLGFGVRGETVRGNAGVQGQCFGNGDGVRGISAEGNGVVGRNTAPVSSRAGVSGQSTVGPGVEGFSNKGNGVEGHLNRSDVNVSGFIGGTDPVFKQHAGVFGTSDRQGVMGLTTSDSGTGVFGGGAGKAGDPGAGGFGVRGETVTGVGVQGKSFGSNAFGFLGGRDPLFHGAVGVYGESVQNGVFGRTASSVPEDNAVYGQNDGAGHGVAGVSRTGIGVFGTSASGLAAKFKGDVEVTGDIRLTGGQDCAEEFDVPGAQEIEPGTVMVINEDGALRQSEHEYDKKVAGVVSGAGDYRPGIVLGKSETLSDRLPIALLGKVYCKVDARISPIEVGDLLTTSATPGYAMKADCPTRALGALIGKALRPLREGQGMIPILVALQ